MNIDKYSSEYNVNVSRQTMLGLEKHAPNSDSLLHEDFLGVVIEFEILPPLDKLGVRYLKYLPEEEQLVERLWNILATEVIIPHM